MATQFDPIAKDESLNTTEVTPRNIADVLAEELSGIASALTPSQLSSLADVTITSAQDGQTLKYDAVSQKWVNANDAGGHIIENPAGTDMTQRANLQFADAHLTDDGVNDRTEVENILDITAADFANATEDGFYNVTDESDEELTAYDIAYDSNDSIGEKIDSIAITEIARLTGDGVKTYGDIFAELVSGRIGALGDNAYIMSGAAKYFLTQRTDTIVQFTSLYTSSSDVALTTLSITQSEAKFYRMTASLGINDQTTTIYPSGRVAILYA